MFTYTTIPSVSSIKAHGKPVCIRCDFNVPVDEQGKVLDAFRISQSIETIQAVLLQGGIPVLISHIESTSSLEPVVVVLKEMLKKDIVFVKDLLALDEMYFRQSPVGTVFLVENIRQYEGEKKNDVAFAKRLAGYFDAYVNEAFSVSHRAHASVSAVPRCFKGRAFAGLTFLKEVKELSKAFAPQHPFVFVLGGAKFDTKLPLLQKYIAKTDIIILCGALANDVYAFKGIEVGVSKKSDVVSDAMKEIAGSEKVKTLSTVIVIKKDDTGSVRETAVESVHADESIMDGSPQGVCDVESVFLNAKTIVWNGPLGNYEIGFSKGTHAMAEAIVRATKNGSVSIVGGGDTVAVIQKAGLTNKFSFVSTGGGAMLDFLLNETLPGIEVLQG